MNIQPTYVSFEQAKALKEKGFDVQCNCFYTKPNSKMFGVDEHGRIYPIKNTPKKLYRIGEYATLNTSSVISAPEQWQLVEWLRINHNIWVWVKPYKDHAADNNDPIQHQMNVYKNGITVSKEFDSHEEAYSAAFDYILKELI
jgi:hypothetical protein